MHDTRTSIPMFAAFLLLLFAVGASASAEALFDSRFTDEDETAAWLGEAESWNVVRRQGVPALESGGPGAAIGRALSAREGEPTHIVVEYGWRAGRGRGLLEARLTNADSDDEVVIVLRQADGEKYEVYWHAGDEDEGESLGSLADDTLDAGVQSGGVALTPAVVHFELDGDQLRIARFGGDTTEVQLPRAFQPAHLTLRDASPGKEQARLARVRAFIGAVDPTSDVVEFRMPFGASFVEDREAPIVRLRGTWFSGEARTANVQLTAEDYVEPDPSAARQFSYEVQMRPGEQVELAIEDFLGLTPGLYRLHGEIAIEDRTLPIDARFAVLSKDLADRPQEEIPQWVGVVPFINVLERTVYPESFEYMEKLGVRHVRWLPGWGRLEPEKGQYEWGESDQFMDLVAEHQMEAMFCLSYYGGDWTHDVTDGQLAHTHEGRTMWVERFAVPTIERYGDRVKLWQIWNEPDAFWNEDPDKAYGFASAFGTPANYYDLVKRTHEAAHQLGHDDIRILASLSSGNYQSNIRLLFEFGLGEHFDGLILHTYGHHVRHFRVAGRLLAELGHDTPALGSGEIGLPRGNDWDGAMRQARVVTQVMSSSITIPNLQNVHWFVLHDTVAGGNFGLINQDLQPHPSALAYYTIARLMSGAVDGEIEERGALTLYRVERSGRSPLLTVTNQAAPTLVTFEVNDGQQPVVWDLMGRSSEPEVTEGRFTVDLTHGLMIEGDVTAASSVEPATTVEFDDKGRPTVNVAVGRPADGAEAVVGLRVPELDFEASQSVGDTGDVSFTLPSVLEPNRQYDAEITVTMAGSEMRQPTKLEATPVYQVTPEQAASPTPPDHLPGIELSGEEAFRLMAAHRTYHGPEDSSAMIYLGWTLEELVLWIEQTDDIHVPIPAQAPNPFGYDSGHWAFQPEGRLAPGESFIEITFGLRDDGEQWARVMGQPHYSPKLQAERSGTTTRYHVTIPAAQLGIVPGHGVSIGTAVIINDNDGEGRKGWLFWGEGVHNQKNPAQYRRVILTEGSPEEHGQ
ncbi:beta-galactosidase [Phycisphaerales bacterium AB-hyl4]|uniref:Beta-galactosidase n=1 Tax=Natronomicrosphaera hydrolytica TaxID=3242702 RepID=A0ABV4U5I1_9BACT